MAAISQSFPITSPQPGRFSLEPVEGRRSGPSSGRLQMLLLLYWSRGDLAALFLSRSPASLVSGICAFMFGFAFHVAGSLSQSRLRFPCNRVDMEGMVQWNYFARQ
jgi:hypothetical protein